jgi:hypothetical protein
MVEINDLIEPRETDPARRPPAAPSVACPTPSPDHSEKTESRPPIRGNLKIDFARKRQDAARKLANTITLPPIINHTVQRLAASSRTTRVKTH